MNRRDSLKTLMAASGALISLPAWAEGWSPDKLIIPHSSFTLTEQDLLASVADTIIPAGNSIGAVSVGVDKFLQKLFQDCYEQDVQANIKNQLQKLDRILKVSMVNHLPNVINSSGRNCYLRFQLRG